MRIVFQRHASYKGQRILPGTVINTEDPNSWDAATCQAYIDSGDALKVADDAKLKPKATAEKREEANEPPAGDDTTSTTSTAGSTQEKPAKAKGGKAKANAAK